jgi:cytochrome c-type biogenesis protein CcmE
MSRIDEELSKVLRESEENAAAEPVVTTPPVERPARKRSVGMLVALVAMGGGILTMILLSGSESSIYSRSVTQVLSESSKLQGRNVRVQGDLKRCTLVRRDDPCEYRFTLHEGGKELAVHYAQCIISDTIRDVPGVQVTAEGTIDPAGHFQASTVFGKCSSKYEDDKAAGKLSKVDPCPVRVGQL